MVVADVVQAAFLEVEDAVVLDVARAARRLGRSSEAGTIIEMSRTPSASSRRSSARSSSAPRPAAAIGRHRPAKDPGARAVDARGDRPGDLVADERDERRLARGDRGEHVGERERAWRPAESFSHSRTACSSRESSRSRMTCSAVSRAVGLGAGSIADLYHLPQEHRPPWNHARHAWKPPTS
jgi:hypothetical protein